MCVYVCVCVHRHVCMLFVNLKIVIKVDLKHASEVFMFKQ